MESNFLTVVFLPLALFIIMLGMGLGLTVEDFKRIWVEPKSVLMGLIAQLIMLPMIGFLLANLFPLSPELAVGVIILAACPGGSTSNLMTYLIRGNVALSVTLTAISSVVTVFTIPLVINLAMQTFMQEAVMLQLPLLKTVMQIALITIIPVILGMLLNHYAPQFAAKVEWGVKWLSLSFLALIVVGILATEWANVVSFFLQVGGVTFALNISTMALGFGLAILTQLDIRSAKAIAIEVGIQNGTLAITIASSPTFLNTASMAIPAGIYSLIMFITSAIFAGIMQRYKDT